jgi:hypothetical protein
MVLKKKKPTKKVSSRARTRPSSTTKEVSTTPKKRTSKKTTSKKTTAKKTSTSRPAAKKTSAREKVQKVAKPASKRGGANREMDEVTGFATDTDSQFIAEALMEGGETRQDIIDWLKDNMEGETRNGTEKPIANLVAGVYNKLLDRGFTVEATYRLVPPVPKGRKRK